MKTMTNTRTKESGKHTGFVPVPTGVAGVRTGTVGGTSAGRTNTGSTTTTKDTVNVPKSYIVGTLCNDSNVITVIGRPVSGPNNGDMFACSAGILVYALLGIGGHVLSTHFTTSPKIVRGDIEGVPMTFLPTKVHNSWVSYSTNNLPETGITLNRLFECYRNFIMTKFDIASFLSGATSGTANHGPSSNISKWLLLYTLYVEGTTAIDSCSGTGRTNTVDPASYSSYSMGFLPYELRSAWKTSVTNLFAANPNANRNDMIESWKSFILNTVGGNYERYMDQFAMLCQKGSECSAPTTNC